MEEVTSSPDTRDRLRRPGRTARAAGPERRARSPRRRSRRCRRSRWRRSGALPDARRRAPGGGAGGCRAPASRQQSCDKGLLSQSSYCPRLQDQCTVSMRYASGLARVQATAAAASTLISLRSGPFAATQVATMRIAKRRWRRCRSSWRAGSPARPRPRCVPGR